MMTTTSTIARPDWRELHLAYRGCFRVICQKCGVILAECPCIDGERQSWFQVGGCLHCEGRSPLLPLPEVEHG